MSPAVLKNAAAFAAAFFFSGPVSAQGFDLRLEKALTVEPGDPARGRSIVLDKSLSSCVLCHAVPGNDGPAGDVGPPLTGVGARLSAAQLRLRIVDSSRINPASVMPPYHRIEELNRVPAALRGKPLLSAQQVEDVVAWLRTLK